MNKEVGAVVSVGTGSKGLNHSGFEGFVLNELEVHPDEHKEKRNHLTHKHHHPVYYLSVFGGSQFLHKQPHIQVQNDPRQDAE